MQALVLTPRGEIAHVVTGYADAADLLDELKVALDHVQAVESTPHDRKLVLGDRVATRRETVAARTFRGPLASWAKRAALRDLDYVAKRPLQPYRAFRPTELTGSGQTFFGSSSGERPKGRIGTTAPGDLPNPGESGGLERSIPPEKLKELLEHLDELTR